MGLGTPTATAASLLLTFAAGLLSKELFTRWEPLVLVHVTTNCSSPISTVGNQKLLVPSLRYMCWEHCIR